MACANTKPLCERLVLSQSIDFSVDTLTINIPSGSYEDKEKYCIVLAQEIPTDTTIGASVVITIGEDDTEYPLVNCDCTKVSPAELSTRMRYSTIVHTDIQSGVFKLLGRARCCSCSHSGGALSDN